MHTGEIVFMAVGVVHEDSASVHTGEMVTAIEARTRPMVAVPMET